MSLLDDIKTLDLKVPDTAPELSRLENPLFAYVWMIYTLACEDGYENLRYEWGLSFLKSGEIGVGPFVDYKTAEHQIALEEILEKVEIMFPEERVVGNIAILVLFKKGMRRPPVYFLTKDQAEAGLGKTLELEFNATIH